MRFGEVETLDCPRGHATSKWKVYDRERSLIYGAGSRHRVYIAAGELGEILLRIGEATEEADPESESDYYEAGQIGERFRTPPRHRSGGRHRAHVLYH